MGAYVYPAIYNLNFITLFIRFFAIHSGCRKFAELVALIRQINSLPAGSCHDVGYQCAIFILPDFSVGRSKQDCAAVPVTALCILLRLSGYHAVIQRHAILTGDRHNRIIRCIRRKVPFNLCFIFRRYVNTGICRQRIIHPRVCPGLYRNVSVSRRHRPGNYNIFYGFQFHIAACIYFAIDTLFFSISKPYGSCFQIALAGRRQVSGHFHQPQPHGRIVAARAIDAFHIRILACQIDKHAAVSLGAAVLFRCSRIIQDTDGVRFGTDHPG